MSAAAPSPGRSCRSHLSLWNQHSARSIFAGCAAKDRWRRPQSARRSRRAARLKRRDLSSLPVRRSTFKPSIRDVTRCHRQNIAWILNCACAMSNFRGRLSLRLFGSDFKRRITVTLLQIWRTEYSFLLNVRRKDPEWTPWSGPLQSAAKSFHEKEKKNTFAQKCFEFWTRGDAVSSGGNKRWQLLSTWWAGLGPVVWTAASHGFLLARSHGDPYWKTGNSGLCCLTCLTCLSKDARGLIYNALTDRATGKPVLLCLCVCVGVCVCTGGQFCTHHSCLQT